MRKTKYLARLDDFHEGRGPRPSWRSRVWTKLVDPFWPTYSYWEEPWPAAKYSHIVDNEGFKTMVSLKQTNLAIQAVRVSFVATLTAIVAIVITIWP